MRDAGFGSLCVSGREVCGPFHAHKATGAGAAARRSMGTGVFGGMLAATFIATLFVPLFFVLTASRRADPQQEATASVPNQGVSQ